jgi:magnesium transporter
MAIELVKPSTAPAAPAPVAGEAGVIAAGVYAGGRRIRDIPIEEAGQWFKRPGHVVWIGLYEPSGQLLRRVQKQFDLHEMAIEDAEQAHQRPKVEQYGEALFIVARTAQLDKGRIAFGETHLFVGRGYIVSVRHGASTSYSAVRQHLEACPIVLANGEDYILYGILDFIVDNYMPVIEAVHAEIDEIEDKVFSAALEEKAIERLYMLRRDLLRLRNAAVPLIEVCKRLEHAEARRVEASMQPLFRDVTDHVHRVQEEIDSLREVLAFAFEASLMTGQAQQAHITRRLAAWAAILAVPTAVAGIYGMNFEYMPELRVGGAYFVVLGAVVAICATLYWRFRKHGWV